MAIIVGFANNPQGRSALQFAAEEARLRTSDLVIVNAVRGEASVETSAVDSADLEKIRKRFEETGLNVRVLQPLGPNTADSILHVSERSNATMIVVGLRKRSPVGKLFLGSTAQHILLNATCPVVAVKAN